MSIFQGALTALVTPFRDDEVDEQALRDLVEWQIAEGIDGLVPCGTTGESATLSADEHRRVIRIVVGQARGRVPVVAGAGTASTRHTVELCKAAREERADGLLLVTPYYNRPTPAGIVAHFRQVLTQVPMPTILYNIPSRTGTDVTCDTLEELSNLSQIVAIKEATGGVLRSQQIVSRFGDRFSVLSGDDALTLAVLAVGGQGVVSVTSNVAPGRVASVVKLFNRGDVERARSLHFELLSAHDAMFVESNPGPVKAALASQGKIAPEIRLPLLWPSTESQLKIKKGLAQSGVAS